MDSERIDALFLSEDGEEITTKFLREGATLISIYSYYSWKPGNENFIAIEDTVLAILHYDNMQYLYKTRPLNTIGRVIT